MGKRVYRWNKDGRITVPKELRDRHDIRPGQEFDPVVVDGLLHIVRRSDGLTIVVRPIEPARE